MVAAIRRGRSLRAVARRFGVGVATVAHWVGRARGQRLDRVDWSDRPSAPHHSRRTDSALEDLVLKVREELAHSDLGAIGAGPIRQALRERGAADVPSVRNAVSYIEYLSRLGYSSSMIQVVLNRHSKKGPLSDDRIEQSLGRSISVRVPNAFNEVIRAINSGTPNSRIVCEEKPIRRFTPPKKGKVADFHKPW